MRGVGGPPQKKCLRRGPGESVACRRPATPAHKHGLHCAFVLAPSLFLSFGRVNPGPLILVSAGLPQTDIFFGEGVGFKTQPNKVTHASQEQLPPHAAAAVKTDCPSRRHGKEERFLSCHQHPSLPAKNQRKRPRMFDHRRNQATSMLVCKMLGPPSQLPEPARSALSRTTNTRQFRRQG